MYSSEDEDEAEEEKKPVVVVNNKPLAKVDACESANAGEQNAEKKIKKKKKTANSVTATSTLTSSQPSTSASVQPSTSMQSVDTLKVVPKPKVLDQQSKPGKPKLLKPKTMSTQPPTKAAVKKTSVDKFKAKHSGDKLKRVAHKTIVKMNKPTKFQNQKGLSDERLKAFGINPKKFNKKQKYASQTATQKQGAKAKNPVQLKKTEKIKNNMKNKLKKALLSS